MTDRNVASIGLVGRTVNQDAIDMAEGVLARLRSGESVAVAFVEVMRGHTVATGWAKNDVYHLLNSGITRLMAAHALVEDSPGAGGDA